MTVNEIKNKGVTYWYRNADSTQEQRDVAKFLGKADNEVYILSKKAEKAMKDLDNMVFIDDYIKDFKDDGRNFDSYIMRNLFNKHKLAILSDDINKIKDKMFKKMSKYLISESKSDYPECLISEKTKQKIKDFNVVNESWKKHFKRKC